MQKDIAKKDAVAIQVNRMRAAWQASAALSADKWRAKKRGDDVGFRRIFEQQRGLDARASRHFVASLRAKPSTPRGIFWQLAWAARMLRDTDLPGLSALGDRVAKVAFEFGRRRAFPGVIDQLFYLASADLAPFAMVDGNARTARALLFNALRGVPHGREVR